MQALIKFRAIGGQNSVLAVHFRECRQSRMSQLCEQSGLIKVGIGLDLGICYDLFLK